MHAHARACQQSGKFRNECPVRLVISPISWLIEGQRKERERIAWKWSISRRSIRSWPFSTMKRRSMDTSSPDHCTNQRIHAGVPRESRFSSPSSTRFLTVASGHETSFRKGIKNEEWLLNIPEKGERRKRVRYFLVNRTCYTVSTCRPAFLLSRCLYASPTSFLRRAFQILGISPLRRINRFFV